MGALTLFIEYLVQIAGTKSVQPKQELSKIFIFFVHEKKRIHHLFIKISFRNYENNNENNMYVRHSQV